MDTISDSSKQVDTSNKPIEETHIVDGINNLSVGVVSAQRDNTERGDKLG